MPITFYNVKSGETKVVATHPDDVDNPDDFDARYVEPKIAALYNSSDLGVNARSGQDFGWRLAPETVKRLRDIRRDEELVRRIADGMKIPEENLEDSNILTWIANEDARKARMTADSQQTDYEREYDDKLRALDDDDEDDSTTEKTDTTTKTAPKRAAPKQSAAQKKAAAKQKADEKKRAENIEAGRDLNDGIDSDEKTDDGLGDIEE